MFELDLENITWAPSGTDLRLPHLAQHLSPIPRYTRTQWLHKVMPKVLLVKVPGWCSTVETLGRGQKQSKLMTPLLDTLQSFDQS